MPADPTDTAAAQDVGPCPHSAHEGRCFHDDAVKDVAEARAADVALVESRDWWRAEADLREREYTRMFLLMGVAAIAGVLGAFWLGVFLG